MEDLEREDLQAQQELQPQQQEKSVFQILNDVNVNENTEKKDKLTYLSWVWAWSEVKKRFADATYDIKHWDGIPYHYNQDLGYMVETSVTIQGQTLPMWLPVMDSKNKARKSENYTYKTTSFGKTIEKTVEAATMFDINTAIMRCLCKNLAMFGLGLYIYAGEDLPEVEKQPKEKQPNYEDFSLSEIFENFAKPAIVQATTGGELREIWDSYPQLHEFEDFRNSLTVRKHYLGIK